MRCETKLCSGEARRSRCPVFCSSLSLSLSLFSGGNKRFFSSLFLPLSLFPTETTVRAAALRMPACRHVRAYVHACVRANVAISQAATDEKSRLFVVCRLGGRGHRRGGTPGGLGEGTKGPTERRTCTGNGSCEGEGNRSAVGGRIPEGGARRGTL